MNTLADILGIPGIHLSLQPAKSQYSVSAEIRNMTQRPVRIGLLGSVLAPSDERYQRLFVAGTRWGTDVMTCGPGRSVIHMASVCMDEHLKIPDGIIYSPSPEAAPEELIRAARRWVSQTSGDDGADFMIQDEKPWDLQRLQLLAHGKEVLR